MHSWVTVLAFFSLDLAIKNKWKETTSIQTKDWGKTCLPLFFFITNQYTMETPKTTITATGTPRIANILVFRARPFFLAYWAKVEKKKYIYIYMYVYIIHSDLINLRR